MMPLTQAAVGEENLIRRGGRNRDNPCPWGGCAAYCACCIARGSEQKEGENLLRLQLSGLRRARFGNCRRSFRKAICRFGFFPRAARQTDNFFPIIFLFLK